MNDNRDIHALSRRDVLALAAAGVAGMVLASKSSAHPHPEMTPIANWRNVAQSAFPKNHPASSIFDTSLDEQIKVAMQGKGFKRGSAFRYRPSLTEPLLGDISALLERCSRYRKEAMDSEALAVRTELDFHVARAVFDSDSDQAQVDGLMKVLAQQKEGFSHSADAARASSDSLKDAWALWMKGSERANSAVAELEAAKAKANLEKITHIYEREVNLYHRANDNGNTFNHVQRFQRAKELLLEDLTEAYEKAYCVEEGLPLVHGIEVTPTNGFQVPEITGAGFVEQMIGWTRRVMRAIDDQRQHEAEYDLVLPLLETNPPTYKGLIKAPTVREAIDNSFAADKSGIVEFQIFSECFALQKNVRLGGVGLSYGVPDGNVPMYRKSVVWATVELPRQAYTGKEINQRVPLMFFRDVRLFEHGVVTPHNTTLACIGVSPIGTWRIKIEPSIGSTDAYPARSTINQIYLHLRVVSEGGKSLTA